MIPLWRRIGYRDMRLWRPDGPIPQYAIGSWCAMVSRDMRTASCAICDTILVQNGIKSPAHLAGSRSLLALRDTCSVGHGIIGQAHFAVTRCCPAISDTALAQDSMKGNEHLAASRFLRLSRSHSAVSRSRAPCTDRGSLSRKWPDCGPRLRGVCDLNASSWRPCFADGTQDEQEMAPWRIVQRPTALQ